MKKSLKNWLNSQLASRATKYDQWNVDSDLVFSSDTLEPRVLLSALAVQDIAEVSEDAVFDSTVDGLNGDPSSDSVKDNDVQVPFTSTGPDDLDVNELGVNDLNTQLGLPSFAQPLSFNSDGTFAFDGTGSSVVQALSEGEVKDFGFQYEYVGQTDGATEGTDEVTLRVTGANDEFEVDFGGPEYEYTANGNAVVFADPLAVVSDVDANDYYSVTLEVCHTNPTHDVPGNPLGMLYLESAGEDTGAGTLELVGTLEEINAQLEEVRFKPANVEASDILAKKLEQEIKISVSEYAGADDTTGAPTTTVESSAILKPVLDASGEVVYNSAPVAANEQIAFNENNFDDIKTGNLLANDTDADGDDLVVTGVTFGGVPGTAAVNTIEGVDYAFELEGEYGTLYYNTDGSYAYEFADDVDFLAFGEQVSDDFEYTIQDSAWNDGEGPGVLSVVISGAKDAPEFVPKTNSEDEVVDFTRPDTGVTDVVTERDRVTEQANAMPLEIDDLSATFTDLDLSDDHVVQIKGVYLVGEVPNGKNSGDYKTDGDFYDALSFGEIVQDVDDEGNPLPSRELPLNFSADASLLNYLDEGDRLTLYYEICVTDPKDCTTTAFVRIRIDGSEDNPIVHADQKGDVVEGDPGDDPITDTGVLSVLEIDEDDNFSFIDNGTQVGTYGSLTVVTDAGGVESWEYVLDNETPIVQMLNEGELVKDIFTLTVFDDNGDPVPVIDSNGEPVLDGDDEPVYQTVEICVCVTGTDDEPVADGDMMVWVIEGQTVDSPSFAEGVISASDIDSLDNPTFLTNDLQPGSGTAVGTYGQITQTVLVPNEDYVDGDESTGPEFFEQWTYELDQSLVQYLAKDEILEDTVTLTSYDYSKTDEHGNVLVEESVSKTIIIKIKGTNDGPEVTSDEVTLTEDPDKTATDVGLTAAGTLDVSDIDLSDEVAIAVKPLVSTTIERDIAGKGATEPLYTEVDGWQEIDGYASVDSSDVDANLALLSMLGLPTGPVVAAGDDTGVADWTFDSGLEGFDFLAAGERLVITYDVCVTDSCGDTADATITVTILGSNDMPEIFLGEHDTDMYMAKENFSGNGMGNDNGNDGNGYNATGTLSVSDADVSDFVTGDTSAGQGVTAVDVVYSGGTVPPDTGLTEDDFLSFMALNNATTVIGVADTAGSIQWEFDSNGEDFDFLAVGETLTMTYTIQVADKDLDCPATYDVTIVIKGTNDRPELKNELPRFDKSYSGSSEDAIDVNDFYNNGTLVSDLLQAQQEDVDVNGSLQGIVVQGVDFSFTSTGAEDWEYSTDDGVTWTAFDADLSAENATVLSTDARVRFVPDNAGENSGWAQLKFSLWDQTDGNASGTTGVDSTEQFVYDADGEPCGESAYGQRMLWFTVEVLAPAADAPVASDDNFDVPADSTTLLGSVLANDNDPDTANGDLTASVAPGTAGVTMFADGTFTFDSTGLLPGQSSSFQYIVSDGTSSDTGTVTINVTEAAVVITGPDEVVIGKGDTFTGSAADLGTISTESWSVDGVTVASGPSFTFDPPATGTYVLSYTATDTSGGIATGSVVVEAVSAAIVGGDLLIGGTDDADAISVNVFGSNYRVNVNGVLSDFAIADVTGEIIICGYEGDDAITVALAVTQATQIDAGGGDDTVNGGGGDDFIEGGSGNDLIVGRGGDDEIYGQGGDDELLGQGGNDTIFTGTGNDIAKGGTGDDDIRGDGGEDTIEGNAGNDLVYGGTEDDNLSGGLGDDEVYGQEGDDIVDGDAGDDYVSGGEGNDTITGGIGDDEIFGMGGDDFIVAHPGDDIIRGGDGNDTISAGKGDDVVYGGLGDDVINGNAGEDTVFGEGGNDNIKGGLDNDELFGGVGDDDIFGNAGDDELTGGVGTDLLNGGLGIDTAIDVGETEILIEL